MPSRINHTYWGNPSDWIYSNNSQQQCKMCKTYYTDIVYAHNELLNKFYDTSVAVWGIPYDCSVGRKTTVSWYVDSSKNVIVEYTEPYLRTNVPLTMLTTSGATPNGNRYNRDPYVYAYYNCRIKDDVSIANRSYSETYPSGTRTASHQFSTTGGGTSPQYNLLSLQTTYYDYRRNIHSINATLCPKTNFGRGSAFLVGNDLDTLIGTTWDNLKTTYNYESDEDIVITGASYIVYSGLRLSSSASVRADIQGSAFLYPQVSVVPSTRTKAIYYTAGNDKIGDGIYQNVNHIGLGYISSGTLKYPNLSTLPTATTYFNNKTTAYSSTNDVMSQCDNIFAISRKKQKFSDVEYHWGVGLVYGGESLVGSFNLIDIDNLNLTGITSNQEKFISMVPYLVIDDDKGNGYKMACKYALMHEYAFYGMPFTTSNSSAINSVWDSSCEDIYIPLFDENMMTTGDYVTLKKAYEQYLPQTVWTDLFNEQSIYNYDPEFQPEPPAPDEGDSGDLYNIGTRRFFWNSLNVYLLSVANYDQFIQKLNALNMTDPDNETWQLQFKGLNPSDYIVGAYVSFVKPPKNTAATIMLGPVDMQQTEYTYKDTDSNAGFFSFGTKEILPKFNDFRDYAPYTMIEVYLPLCGTVEIDTAYFMGCSMKIDYYYDIYTMSCVACIYRVKEGQELLYKTVNGTIGAQIPMLSANMGAYQNQIKSIENALKQNELKLMTSTAALAAGVVAAPMTSGASLIAAGTAAFSGAAGLAQSVQKQSELEYQIEHLQPSISVTGAADPQTDLCIGQLMPKIIIKRAKMLATYNQEEYAKTIGHACCINDILGYVEGDTESPRSGLVVCSSVDTSGISQTIGDNVYISPTADEVNMIKQALSSGVIL